MVDRSNSERPRGFGDGQTDRRMDICYSRVAFATENNISTHGSNPPPPLLELLGDEVGAPPSPPSSPILFTK